MSTKTIDKCYGYMLIQRIIYGCLGGVNSESKMRVFYAKYLFNKYRKGTWSDRAYRAIWHACPEVI